jgi:Zn-dependent peptidase ImmA (M78 family)
MDSEAQPFDARRLRDVLAGVRPLTRQADFGGVVERVRHLLAEAGVVLVLTPEFEGTRLSGAARWLSADRALIQLSLRHKTNDHFWFSLFHEAGHLLARKRIDVVDLADGEMAVSEAEDDADRFARDTLVPPAEYAAFVDRATFSDQAVREFAQRLEVAPGIVVGRLQRDGHIDPNHLNGLKKRVDVAQPGR